MGDIISFSGFAGIRLAALATGPKDAPPILLIHGAAQHRGVWSDVSQALASAGRRVVSIDLRGHGDSEWPRDARYDFDAFVEDLRAVLAQMDGRPVVVASAFSGWIATAALERDGSNLAAGLVLVDLPTELDPDTTQRVAERLRHLHAVHETPRWDLRWIENFDTTPIASRLAAAAPHINVPVLIVRGGLSGLASEHRTAAFASQLPDAEYASVADQGQLVTENGSDTFNALLLDFLERRQPRAAPEFRSGCEPRTLRDALGCFATGVTIVTSVTDVGAPIGLTANSFTSLSLDPPLLLVCIAKRASCAAALSTTPRFAVNVLQIGQQLASTRFGAKGEDRFTGTDWEIGESGVPILKGSLGAFECERHAVHDGGDHFILVGRVEKVTFEPRRDPLLYFRGKYRRLHFA